MNVHVTGVRKLPDRCHRFEGHLAVRGESSHRFTNVDLGNQLPAISRQDLHFVIIAKCLPGEYRPVALKVGHGERASALLTDSLSLSEGIGFQEGIAWSVEQLGLLAAVDGDPAAVSLLRRSLEVHRELRDRWRMSSVLEDLSALALAQGHPLQAARLLGAAEAMRDAIGTVIAPSERLQHNQTTAAVRTALGDEAFDAALRRGLLATSEELAADLPSAQTPTSNQSNSEQTSSDQLRP